MLLEGGRLREQLRESRVVAHRSIESFDERRPVLLVENESGASLSFCGTRRLGEKVFEATVSFFSVHVPTVRTV